MTKISLVYCCWHCYLCCAFVTIQTATRPNMKVTYKLSTSECMSSHSNKWREEQPFILNHTSFIRMLTKYENGLYITSTLSTFRMKHPLLDEHPDLDYTKHPISDDLQNHSKSDGTNHPNLDDFIHYLVLYTAYFRILAICTSVKHCDEN